jgi:hypothetical protein
VVSKLILSKRRLLGVLVTDEEGSYRIQPRGEYIMRKPLFL